MPSGVRVSVRLSLGPATPMLHAMFVASVDTEAKLKEESDKHVGYRVQLRAVRRAKGCELRITRERRQRFGVSGTRMPVRCARC